MPIAVRFFFVFVLTAAYLGLAVLGEGGITPFFSHPPLVALAVATLLISIFAFFAGGSVSAGEREDRSNRWVLTAFGVLGLLIGFVPAYTDRIGFWTIDGDTVRWIGVVVFTIGGLLRIWPVYILGNRFSGLVAIQKGHTLVTTSIYGIIRHPSYLGLLTNSLGWALAFRSVVGIVLTALLVPIVVARMNSEEALLLSQFGDEYNAYRARTSRLLPHIY